MPLKLVKRHGSPFWYMRGSVRGQPVNESTKTDDREQAEAVRAKREWEIVNRQIGGGRAVATFLEAAVSYMENGGEARFVKPLLDHFKATPLSQIGQAEVDACARRLYPGRAPATVNRMVYTPVSAIMTHAAKRKLCDKPAFERPKQPRARVRWITHEEADRLILCSAPHLAPIVTFMLFTGCRVSEALELDWRDVDLNRAHATFLDTKNGERRGVYLHPRALAALANLSHRTGAVFRRPALRIQRTCRGRADQERLQGCLPPRRDHEFSSARLPPHLGDVALCGQPRSWRADGIGRLEIGRDGDALRPLQQGSFGRWRAANWGNHGKRRSGDCDFSRKTRRLQVNILDLDMVGVRGSIPLAPTISPLKSLKFFAGTVAGLGLAWPLWTRDCGGTQIWLEDGSGGENDRRSESSSSPGLTPPVPNRPRRSRANSSARGLRP